MRWKLATQLLLLTPLLLSVVPLHQIFDGFGNGSQLAGRRVLICGASGGLGEQMALHYAAFGAHVAVVARRRPELERVAEAARQRGAASATAIVGDMASEESIVAAINTVLDIPAFGGELDVLVLNHAVQYWDWLLPSAPALREARVGEPNAKALDFAYIDKMVSVNFVSFVKLATAAMPALVRGAEGRPGSRPVPSSIIVISSGGGKVAVPKQSIYSGCKHALHGFFDSLRLEIEHKRLPVMVTNVILGSVSTEKYVTSAHEDVSYPPPIPADEAALGIIRCGAAGVEECYCPLSHGLHVTAILRPLAGMRWFLDRTTLAVSGGRNVFGDIF